MGRETRTSISREQMVKPVDSWWTVLLIDPIASRLAPSIARWPVMTPSRITAFAHVLAVVSAALFSQGSLLAAALLFELRFIADCIDGKVARLTGTSSAFGRLFDAFGDRVLVTVNLAAIGWAYAPVAGLVLAGAYPLSHHLLEVRDLAYQDAGRTKRVEATARTGYGAAMARHRLYPMPTSIDLEHAALFVGPIVAVAAGDDDVVRVVLWLTAAFFVGQGLRYFAGLLSAAAEVDSRRLLRDPTEQ